MTIEQLCFINYIFFGICVTIHIVEKEGRFSNPFSYLTSIMSWPIYLLYLAFHGD